MYDLFVKEPVMATVLAAVVLSFILVVAFSSPTVMTAISGLIVAAAGFVARRFVTPV